MMNRQKDFPEELYNDEVLNYIADRHHSTPSEIMQWFMTQNTAGCGTSKLPLQLEDNEIEILKELVARCRQ